MIKIKSIQYIAAILSIVIMASSCLATKKYTVPEVNQNVYLFRLDSLQLTQTVVSNIKWQDFYQDEYLKKYIETALANNFDNQVALKNINIFEAHLKRSKLGQLPELNIDLNVQRQGIAKNSQFGDFFSGSITTYRLNSALTWEADIWGKINSQKLASEAAFQRSLTAQKLLQTTIVSNVANTYFKLIEADKRKEILQQTYDNRKNTYEITLALKDAGLENAVSVGQSLAQLNQIEINLEQVKNEIFTLENALLLLLGTTMEKLERSSLDEQNLNDIFEQGISLETLRNRPDVLVAELDFRNAFEQVNIATASLYPTIRLTLNAGFESIEFSKFIDPGSLVNTLIGGVTAPVFNRKRLKTQKEISEIQRDQRYIQFKKQLFNAGIEVSNVFKNYQATQANFTSTIEQEQVLETAHIAALEMFKSGVGNYLNVLLIQERLLNNQLSKATLMSQQFQSQAALYRAIGGE
ncbi:MAG: efflux transporter outer membrane subunit [Chitinophagales bacterium]|nr:efflux transporter outer membrane subunit [Chitinophagales bacterium]